MSGSNATEANNESMKSFQEPLFEASETLSPEFGYRAKPVQDLVGISYRQLDHWDRTGLVSPSIGDARGSGSRRLYSFRDVLILKVIKRLLDTGISLQNIRNAVGHLREIGIEELSEITLMSDGASIYECTSVEEVIDLTRGGQGVFAIALGPVWRDTESQLLQLPAEDTSTGEYILPENHTDELAARRSNRAG